MNTCTKAILEIIFILEIFRISICIHITLYSNLSMNQGILFKNLLISCKLQRYSIEYLHLRSFKSLFLFKGLKLYTAIFKVIFHEWLYEFMKERTNCCIKMIFVVIFEAMKIHTLNKIQQSAGISILLNSWIHKNIEDENPLHSFWRIYIYATHTQKSNILNEWMNGWLNEYTSQHQQQQQ